MRFEIDRQEVEKIVKEYYKEERNCKVKDVKFVSTGIGGAIVVEVKADVVILGTVREVEDMMTPSKLESLIVKKLSDDVHVLHMKMNLDASDVNAPTLKSVTIDIEKIIKKDSVNKR